MMEMEDLNRLNDYLLNAVQMQTILEFDTRFKNIFEDVFYNVNNTDDQLSSTNDNKEAQTTATPTTNDNEAQATTATQTTSDKEAQTTTTTPTTPTTNDNKKAQTTTTATTTTTKSKASIISHFLKHWKSIQDYSGITKTLPTILTGSVVEGSPLARLFYPDMKDEMEIEADVMYVVGCIDQDDAIQSIHSAPGFLWLKKTPNIQLFMTAPLPTLDSITEFHEEYNNTSFINGNILKVMHKTLQPSSKQLQRNLDILEDPYEVTIDQSTQGPSSEIIFNIRRIVDSEERIKVVNFLQRARTVIEGNITNYETAMERISERQNIMLSVVNALEETVFIDLRSLVTSEDKADMTTQLSSVLIEHLSECKQFSQQRTNILEALNSLKTILNINYDMDDAFKLDSFGKINGHDNLFPLVDSMEEDERTSQLRNFLTEIQKLKRKIMHTSILIEIREDLNKIRETSDHFMSIISKRIPTIKENSKKQKENAINGRALTVSFDNVSCFYCSFWPEIASEWISRKRLWPSSEVIDKIVASGSYIVAKSRPGPGCENELDWRWSFSTAEIQLAQERTTLMKYCYFLFKSMFYKHFKFKIDDKSLPSYVAKTCMLYVSEMHPSEWWGSLLVEEQSPHRPAKVSYCLMELFKFLERHLQQGSLPHYFIKEINLLDYVPSAIRTKALDIISRIICQPQEYIIFEYETMSIVRELYEDVSNISSSSVNNYCKSENTSSKGVLKLESILKIENKLLANRLINLRLQSMWAYNKNKSRVEFLEKLIPKQEECIRQAGENLTYQHVQLQKLVVSNRNSLSEWHPQFTRYHKALSAGLLEICHLVELYCTRCDVCFQKIPCQSYRYHCSERCNYDICETCYTNSIGTNDSCCSNNGNDNANNLHKSTTTTSNNNNTNGNKTTTTTNNNKKLANVSRDVQGTVAPPASKPHQHPMKYINDCSKNCYSNITNQIKEMDPYKYIQQIRSLEKEAYKLLEQLGMNVGEVCDSYLNSGDIIKDLFAQIFGGGGKDNEYNDDRNNSIQERSDEEKNTEKTQADTNKDHQVENEIGEQPQKLPQKTNGDEDQDIKDLKSNINGIKHKWAKIERLEFMKETYSF